MADIYFQCDWVIRENITLSDLRVISNQLNLNLRLNPFQINEQGFSILPLRIKVADESPIRKLLTEFGEKTGITGWKPVSEDIYMEGFTLANLRKAFEEEPLIVGKWFFDYGDRGRQNSKRLKKMDGNTG